VARIEGLFGIRGELKCRPSSAGEGVLAAGRRFALDDEDREALVCAGVRLHKGRPLVRFEGIADANAAQALVGRSLYLREDEIDLGEDEFLDVDLVGFALFDAGGAPLGTVVGVEHYPAADYLVVGDKRALVPMVESFILGIDREARSMTVSLPPGLLDPSLAEQA
jgi:16S rRNA processing protein RimM